MLCWRLQCGHSCQYFVSTLILFLIYFPLLHFLLIFFYSIILFFFIFVLCSRLQCQHSCQYFVWTLISFLNSFSVTLFPIFIFLFNNFILYYFCCWVDDCNADTHANLLFWLFIFNFILHSLEKCHPDSLHLLDGPRNLHLKFGQNQISNSWDISEMNKCHQDKFCLDKCHRYSWNLLKMVPGTYL